MWNNNYLYSFIYSNYTPILWEYGSLGVLDSYLFCNEAYNDTYIKIKYAIMQKNHSKKAGLQYSGSMGVWEYGSMGVWEYGSMGVWEY